MSDFINENVEKALNELRAMDDDKYIGKDGREYEFGNSWGYYHNINKLGFVDEATEEIRRIVREIFVKYLGEGAPE